MVALGLLGLAAPAQANVYATNIRIRGSIPSTDTAATVYVPCDTVQISYLLNEAATAGVTVEILSGPSVVRTFNFAGGPGTLKGNNSVEWDVKDELGNVVPNGFYSVRITAAATGHGDWTRINNFQDIYAVAPSGVAVNRNTNSPSYGTILVGNSESGTGAGIIPGETVGLQMFHADSSPVEGLSFCTGGWNWSSNGVSPWKIEVGEDDRVYVNDWADHGTVLSFDRQLSPGSRRLVLRGDNRPNSGAAQLSGPFVTGSGLNTLLWMADTNAVDGVGIRAWAVTNAGTITTNDLGATIVEAGTNSHLSLAPYDVALDRSNRIYTIQFTETEGDPAYRVMRFPSYVGAGAPLTNADWRIGSGDDNMRGAHGIAVDPSGTYVAVAFTGGGEDFDRTGGAVRIFSAASGASVQTITPATYHAHSDVAWDNVGNLYGCNMWNQECWVYSPPGPNQATTVGVQTLMVSDPPLGQVVLQAVGYSGGQFFLTLGGRTNIDYIIEGSTNFTAWLPVATNSDPCATRVIAVNATENRQYFRAYPALTP